LDWRQILNLNKAEVVGLDIGSSSVKAVQLRKDDAGYTASSVGIAEILTNEDNKHHPQTNAIKAIRECYESMDDNIEETFSFQHYRMKSWKQLFRSKRHKFAHSMRQKVP
jgi:hypothetical protein